MQFDKNKLFLPLILFKFISINLKKLTQFLDKTLYI